MSCGSKRLLIASLGVGGLAFATLAAFVVFVKARASSCVRWFRTVMDLQSTAESSSELMWSIHSSNTTLQAPKVQRSIYRTSANAKASAVYVQSNIDRKCRNAKAKDVLIQRLSIISHAPDPKVPWNIERTSATAKSPTLLWDSNKFTDLRTEARRSLQNWPCRQPYRGPAKIGQRLLIYVYELPQKIIKSKDPAWNSHIHQQTQTRFYDVLRNSTHRTYDPDKASFFVVPFDVGLCPSRVDCHNPNLFHEMQAMLLTWLTDFGPYWNRNGGADHILSSMACPPFLWDKYELYKPLDQCGPIIACLSAWPGHYRSMIIPYLIDNADFESEEVKYTKKTDKCLPRPIPPRGQLLRICKRVRGHLITTFRRNACDHESCDSDLKKMRKLYLRDVSRNMTKSVFALAPHGDTPEARRIFQGLARGCIPLITTGVIQPAFVEILDWSKLAVLIDLDGALHTRLGKLMGMNKNDAQPMLAKFAYELDALPDTYKRSLLRNVSQIRQSFRYDVEGVGKLTIESLSYRRDHAFRL